MSDDWTFKFKRGTAARWAEVNPVLAAGEPGVEYDDADEGNADRLKIGDGITAWNDLDYLDERTAAPITVPVVNETLTVGASNAVDESWYGSGTYVETRSYVAGRTGLAYIKPWGLDDNSFDLYIWRQGEAAPPDAAPPPTTDYLADVWNLGDGAGVGAELVSDLDSVDYSPGISTGYRSTEVEGLYLPIIEGETYDVTFVVWSTDFEGQTFSINDIAQQFTNPANTIIEGTPYVPVPTSEGVKWMTAVEANQEMSTLLRGYAASVTQYFNLVFENQQQQIVQELTDRQSGDQQLYDYFAPLLSRFLTGAGSPEGVVAAPVGTLYVDTAKTVGAFMWRKDTGTAKTGWKVSDGDTGDRDISGLLNAPAVPSGAGAQRLRRIGNTVHVYLSISWATAWVSGNSILTIPAGFRPVSSMYLPTGYSGAPALVIGNSGAGTLNMFTATTSLGARWLFSYPTNDPWPTVLP